MKPILEAKDLSIYFSLDGKTHTVVDRLSFSLIPGKTLALVGESGSGKSMTALSLLGILPSPPALSPSGEVFFEGHDLLKLSPSRMRSYRGRRIAMIFQDPLSSFNPVYTIGKQLIETFLAHFPQKHAESEEKALLALKEVYLSDPEKIMKSYPHELSGGMLQRAMIAMALICDPSVLIADEPTTALDVTIQAQILHLLKELQMKKGMALMIITHDMGVVAEIADEVIVMYFGKKLEQAPAIEIFNNPSHPYTQALFSSRPGRAAFRKKLFVIPGQVPPLTEKIDGCPFHPRCQWAMDLCKTKNVDQQTLKEKKHKVSCWLYDKQLQWKLDDEIIRS